MHAEKTDQTQAAPSAAPVLPATSSSSTLSSLSFWLRYRQLTYVLLVAWFVSTFGVLFFARELSTWVIFGWSFSVYMAAQGLTLFYVALLGIFAYFAGDIEHDQAHAQRKMLNSVPATNETNLRDEGGHESTATQATPQLKTP